MRPPSPSPVPLPEGFEPYRWATPSAEVADRSGLPAELVLRFDQNVPPLPGVPQVPLARSLAELNLYPDGTYRELREAAAAYAGARSWEHVVVGAGADDLILLCARTYLAPGRRADLVLLQARDPVEAIRLRATRLAVVRAGRIVATSPPAQATLDLPGRPAAVDWTLPRPS